MTNKKNASSAITQELIGCVVIGTALGAAAAFLYGSKNGKKIRDNFSEVLHQATDKAQDFASDVMHKSQNLSYEMADHLFKKKSEKQKGLNILIGGLAGSALGAAAIALLSNHQPQGIFKKITNVIESIT